MTVGELKSLLEAYPEDAEVRMIGQPDYPSEYAIEGLCQRSDFAESDEGDEDEEDSEDGAPNDVLICEGTQLCYGDSAAWDHC